MLDQAQVYVAIPAYNAGKTLDEVLRQVCKQVAKNRVIVVDDGSGDNTAACAERAGVILLRHTRNSGKGAALKTAFNHVLNETSAQAVITLDADGQHAPNEIPKLLQAGSQQASDLVVGTRSFALGVMPVLRILSNCITSKLISWKVKQPIHDSQSGYRLYSRRLLQNVKLYTNGYETESEILLQAGRVKMRIAHVPIATIYNDEISHISGIRDVARFVKLLWKN